MATKPTDPPRMAVLTGDVVDSAGCDAATLASLFEAFEETAVKASLWCGHPIRLTRHRGDGWQCAIADAQLAVRLALALRASARALGQDTRVAVATGQLVEGWMPDSDPGVWVSGPFRDSGLALEKMPRHRNLVHDGARGAHAAALALLDVVSGAWEGMPARAVREALPPDSIPQGAIARRLGVSQPTISQWLRIAHWPEVRDALRALETTRL
jgi:hypothetical protein